MIEQSEPGGVAGWAVGMMDALGAPGAGLAVALENLFPPLPSELILPLAGFSASQGRFSLVATVVWTTLGSLTGALVLYGLGALLGRDRVRAIVARVPLIEVSDVDRSEEWFARHGTKAVFFGRMLPVVRSFVSIPAGVERMPLLPFVLLTTLGSAVWNTTFILAGYLLGENWQVVERYASWFQWVVVAAVVVAVGWFVTVRLRKIKSRDT
jgi:membrane protein DedA with SNARE-associated domain